MRRRFKSLAEGVWTYNRHRRVKEPYGHASPPSRMVGVGKPLILYIRCRIHRLEVLAEAIGVNGSTATTR